MYSIDYFNFIEYKIMSIAPQICIKSKCRQMLDRNLETINNPAITQNNTQLVRRPIKKNKPITMD